MTIPISQIVSVTPSVVSAEGASIQLIALVLTTSPHVPVGQVMSFPTASAVGSYFGLTSKEYNIALVYFSGFAGANTSPGALLFTQYPQSAVAAWLRGAQLTTLTLAQLQLLSGSLTVVVDGYTHTASSINLAAATSYSSAATIINTALNASEPTEASVTASIGASFTATASDTTLTVTAVTGYISVGDVVTGTGVPAGTAIASFVSGTAGGAGVYTTSVSTTASSASCTTTSAILDVTAVSSGTVAVGQTIYNGVTQLGVITALGTGTGLTGTYVVGTTQQTFASGTVTAKATAPVVSFDSVSGALVITSGITGAASTVAYATGTLASSVYLTQATGAVLSLGAAATTPSAFMTAIVLVNNAWATFMTTFDPDSGSGNTQKLAFASWTSSQNYDFAYVCWDGDVTATNTVPATTSLGYQLQQSGMSGTILVYEPSDLYHAPFICGWAAAIDTTQHNGRATLAFKTQSGLLPGVTDATVAKNLIANGYNFYGAYANATVLGNLMYPGSISGLFLWADSYINQIWLNNTFQNSLWQLLGQVKSLPYNVNGYDLIRSALQGPAAQGVNFGAIVPGVTLSALQVAELKAAAGLDISQALFAQGYYIQVLDAVSSVRAARRSPPTTVWYVDGQSVQSINLASVEIQ